MLVRLLILGVFLATYVAITARRLSFLPIGRPSLTLVGACALVALGALEPSVGLSPEEALAAIEPKTLVILFGMMVLGAALDEGGLLPRLAGAAGRAGRVALLYGLTIACGLLSAVAVNDTVCLLVAPLAVHLAAEKRAPRVPYLLAVAMGSNCGSALTLGGNPQNMLVQHLARLEYRAYLVHVAPGVLLALVVTAAILHLIFRRELASDKTERPSSAPPVSATSDVRGQRLAIVAVVVLAGVTVASLAGASLAWSALTGAAIVLVAGGDRAPRLLERVDWSVIVYFAGLFMVIGAVQKTGIPGALLGSLHVPHSARRGVVSLSGVLVFGSQVVSNVPLILLIAPWLQRFSDAPLAWTLTAVVTTLAGNLSLMGSVANVLVIERAGAQREIGFWQYLRVGLPVTLVTIPLTVAIIVLTW